MRLELARELVYNWRFRFKKLPIFRSLDQESVLPTVLRDNAVEVVSVFEHLVSHPQVFLMLLLLL